MYCIKCGVALADTEKSCPLCGTAVYHPDVKQGDASPFYPPNKKPKIKTNSKAFNGAVIILFMIPLLVCLVSDWHANHHLDWFGFSAGALLIAYVAFALPHWFRKPNPVIFLPCTFAAVAAYLFYIDLVTSGEWFFDFALPLTVALALILCSVVTLMRYLKRGALYIFGGAFIAFGAYIMLIEFLLGISFGIAFAGWSFYPLIVLSLIGGLHIFLAINRSAREMMERKLFF